MKTFARSLLFTAFSLVAGCKYASEDLVVGDKWDAPPTGLIGAYGILNPDDPKNKMSGSIVEKNKDGKKYLYFHSAQLEADIPIAFQRYGPVNLIVAKNKDRYLYGFIFILNKNVLLLGSDQIKPEDQGRVYNFLGEAFLDKVQTAELDKALKIAVREVRENKILLRGNLFTIQGQNSGQGSYMAVSSGGSGYSSFGYAEDDDESVAMKKAIEQCNQNSKNDSSNYKGGKCIGAYVFAQSDNRCVSAVVGYGQPNHFIAIGEDFRQSSNKAMDMCVKTLGGRSYCQESMIVGSQQERTWCTANIKIGNSTPYSLDQN